MRAFPIIGSVLLIAAGIVPQSFGQQIVVNGDIPAPVALSLADLAKMPHSPATVLEGDAVVTYRGVALADILKKAGMPSGTQIQGRELTGIVIAKGKGGKRVAFAYAELDPSIGGAGVIIADQREGQPITGPQGPLHLVVPTDRGDARYIDNVQEIQLMHIPAGSEGASARSTSAP